jgi:hypothetical protein
MHPHQRIQLIDRDGLVDVCRRRPVVTLKLDFNWLLSLAVNFLIFIYSWQSNVDINEHMRGTLTFVTYSLERNELSAPVGSV